MFAFHVSHRGPFSIFHDVDTDLKAIHIHNTDMYWYVHIDNNMNNAKTYQTTVFSQIFIGSHMHPLFFYLVACNCFCATIIAMTTIPYGPQILFYLLSSSTEKRMLTRDKIYERKAWKNKLCLDAQRESNTDSNLVYCSHSITPLLLLLVGVLGQQGRGHSSKSCGLAN